MSLKDLERTERKVIEKFLDDAMHLARSVPLEVEILGDGERDYIGAFNRAQIDQHIGNCSETTVCVRHGASRGSVLFVHGLGDEVIANMSGNTEGYDMMAALLKNAEAIAQEGV